MTLATPAKKVGVQTIGARPRILLIYTNSVVRTMARVGKRVRIAKDPHKHSDTASNLDSRLCFHSLLYF